MLDLSWLFLLGLLVLLRMVWTPNLRAVVWTVQQALSRIRVVNFRFSSFQAELESPDICC